MSVNFDKNSNSFFLYGTDAFNLNIDDEPYDIEPFNNPLTQDENIKLAILLPNKDNSDFILQYISPKLAEFYDVDSNVLFGRSIRMIFKIIADDLCSIFKNVIETKQKDIMHINFYEGNRLMFCLKFNINPIEDYLSLTAEDITGEIRMKELSSFKNTSAYIQKTQKYAIGTKFKDGVYSWSNGIYPIIEREPSSYDKTHNILFGIVIPEDRPKLEEFKKHIREQPDKAYKTNLRILTAKNNLKTITLDGKRIFDKHYELEKQVAIIYDITDEIKTQKRYHILNDLNTSINTNFNISGFIVNYENDYYHISENAAKKFHLSNKHPKLLLYDIINNILNPEFILLREKLHNDEIDRIDGIYDYKSPIYDEIQKIHITYFKKEYEGEIYYVGGIQDITRQYESELKLSSKRKELSLLQNTLIDVEKSNIVSIPYLDKEGKYHWPQGIYDLLEKEPSPEDENNNIILNATDEKTRAHINEKISNMDKNEIINNESVKITTGTGKTKYLEVNVRNVYDEDGCFIQQSALCRDITPYHEHESEIKFLTGVLQKINTHLGTGAFIWDRNSDLMIATDSARQIVHIEDRGNTPIELQEFRNNIVDSEKYLEALHKLYSGEIDKIDSIWDYKAPGHDLQKIRVNYQQLIIEDRELWVAGIRDVTSEIERENKIIAANKNMEILINESNHRIKNNLNLLLRFISLEKKFHTKPEHILDNLLGRINSLVVLHEKLSDTENKYDVNAVESFRKMTEDLYNIYKELSSEISFNFEEHEEFKLPNDKMMPVLLILNELVTNTLKYAHSNKITRSEFNSYIKKDGNICECFFKDDGSGYPEGFDPYKTTGLGWVVITSLAKQLNGEFEAYNDNGACFKLRFPIKD